MPTYKLPPVIVTSTRTGIAPEDATTYVTVLTNQDIKQSPQLVLDDLLRQVTGFNTFRRSSSMVTAPADDPEAEGVTLRGVGPGGASRALVMLDGIPVNDAFGGWIYWDEIPLNSIDRIEVVEGGGSNLWGNEAEGGVINIISKPIPDNSGVADASLLRYSQHHSGRGHGELQPRPDSRDAGGQLFQHRRMEHRAVQFSRTDRWDLKLD